MQASIVQLDISQGEANNCSPAPVKNGLFDLVKFCANLNKRHYAYLRLEEKTRITLAFLKCNETEFETIRCEIKALKGDLDSSPTATRGDKPEGDKRCQP